MWADDAFLVALCPDVAGVAAPLRALWLDVARSRIPEDRWLTNDGQKLRQGHALLTGHFLLANVLGNETGPVSSMSHVNTSMSFATKAVDSALESTKYGRAFLELEATTIALGA